MEKSAKKTKIGRIAHYFEKIGVAVIELAGTLNAGDTVSIEGATTNFKQKIDSIQIDKAPVKKAGKGQSVGVKVSEKVRENDLVYKA